MIQVLTTTLIVVVADRSTINHHKPQFGPLFEVGPLVDSKPHFVKDTFFEEPEEKEEDEGSEKRFEEDDKIHIPKRSYANLVSISLNSKYHYKFNSTRLFFKTFGPFKVSFELRLLKHSYFNIHVAAIKSNCFYSKMDPKISWYELFVFLSKGETGKYYVGFKIGQCIYTSCEMNFTENTIINMDVHGRGESVWTFNKQYKYNAVAEVMEYFHTIPCYDPPKLPKPIFRPIATYNSSTKPRIPIFVLIGIIIYFCIISIL